VSAAWLNPAGGLRYHVRGYRLSESLWAPFRFALAEWLHGWEPREKKLVVVGPSAGWCVQPHFFERFEEVLCLEPDPVAHFLFRRRLARAPLEPRPRLRFDAEDRLLADPGALPRLLDAEGEAAVLFSNVLGQVRVLLGAADGNDARLSRVRSAVHAAIAGRSWASFHDRVSGELEPAVEGRFDAEHRLSDDELREHFYATSKPDGAPAPPLLDHLTDGFFPPDRPHVYFSWPLLPGVFHLIEATRSDRT
jgi:hypothetical protein